MDDRVTEISPPAALVPADDSVSQRDAIHNVVDTVANDFGKGVKAARDALNEIEQQYLESAARAKGALNDHVEVCSKLNGEVARWRETIATIKQKMED